MSSTGLQRRLAAILSADVQGYSRLMGQDDEATVATLTAYRAVMSGLIDEHSGRVVDSPGDNLLAEFASVIDAVRCAVAIQEALRERNATLPDDRKMRFRIGLDLGDVLVDGPEIYGDGVNVAARVEALAEAGGVSVSGTVYDQVEGKLPLTFDPRGEQQVKNIAKPVRVYAIRMGHPPAVRAVETPLELPDRPSIAVLPFANMSGDPEQEYFSDGLTEDLITDLSRISGLFVIARNSTFTYKGRATNVGDVGRELGVRHVLEGSVRKAGDRVRITAQLVDAGTGGHLWAERYDRDLRDIFAVQDEVTGKIVRALAVRLTDAERTVVAHRPTESLEAYDCVLRGMELVLRTTKEAHVEARQLFERAIELDPGYATAYARLGGTHLDDFILAYTEGTESLQMALDFARRAARLDDSLSFVHSLLGSIYVYQGRHDEAVVELEKAIALDPNDAEALVCLATILNWAGEPGRALDHVAAAMRLDPLHPAHHLFAGGHAHFLLGDLDDAEAVFQRTLNRNPDFHPAHFYLAATYAEMGRLDEARAHLTKLAAYWSGTAAAARPRLPYRDEAALERLFGALGRVGMPG